MEKHTEHIGYNYLTKLFNIKEYHTEGNKQLFNNRYPDGWLMNGDNLLIIEYKANEKDKQQGFNQLLDYCRQVVSNDENKNYNIFCCLGYGVNENNFDIIFNKYNKNKNIFEDITEENIKNIFKNRNNKIINPFDYVEEYIKEYISDDYINIVYNLVVYVDYVIVSRVTHEKYYPQCHGYIIGYVISNGVISKTITPSQIFNKYKQLTEYPMSYISIINNIQGYDEFIQRNKQTTKYYYYRIQYKTYFNNFRIGYKVNAYIPIEDTLVKTYDEYIAKLSTSSLSNILTTLKQRLKYFQYEPTSQEIRNIIAMLPSDDDNSDIISNYNDEETPSNEYSDDDELSDINDINDEEDNKNNIKTVTMKLSDIFELIKNCTKYAPKDTYEAGKYPYYANISQFGQPAKYIKQYSYKCLPNRYVVAINKYGSCIKLTDSFALADGITLVKPKRELTNEDIISISEQLNKRFDNRHRFTSVSLYSETIELTVH